MKYKNLKRTDEVTNWTYEERQQLADAYLNAKGIPVSWDELCDMNSLWDAETVQDIIDMAKERVNDIMPIFE